MHLANTIRPASQPTSIRMVLSMVKRTRNKSKDGNQYKYKNKILFRIDMLCGALAVLFFSYNNTTSAENRKNRIPSMDLFIRVFVFACVFVSVCILERVSFVLRTTNKNNGTEHRKQKSQNKSWSSALQTCFRLFHCCLLIAFCFEFVGLFIGTFVRSFFRSVEFMFPIFVCFTLSSVFI